MQPPRKILHLLQQLRESSKEPGRFSLNPPLSEQQIAAFEQRHSVALPEEYRIFLSNVGNGGAGPYYGIYALGMNGDTALSDDVLLNLPKWFLHQDDWDVPADIPDPDHRYYSDDVMQGAMPICTVGCATDYWLVVSGPSRGQIWLDSRADHNGIEPIFDDEDEFATFGTWYDQWLKQMMIQVGVA